MKKGSIIKSKKRRNPLGQGFSFPLYFGLFLTLQISYKEHIIFVCMMGEGIQDKEKYKTRTLI